MAQTVGAEHDHRLEMANTIGRRWSDAAEFARLNAADRERLLGTQILNPSIHY